MSYKSRFYTKLRYLLTLQATSLNERSKRDVSDASDSSDESGSDSSSDESGSDSDESDEFDECLPLSNYLEFELPGIPELNRFAKKVSKSILIVIVYIVMR